MATHDQTVDRLRTVIAGIDDGGLLKSHGYRVSTEELFVQAAAVRMRTLARKNWDEADVRRCARLMCTNFLDGVIAGGDVTHPLPRGHNLVQMHWSGGARLANKPNGTSARIMRPSIDVDGVVTTKDLDARQMAGMRATANARGDELEAALRAQYGEYLADERAVSVTRQNAWSWNWDVRFANGTRCSVWTFNATVVHDGASHVVPAIMRKVEAMRRAEEAMRDARSTISSLLRLVNKLIRESGLPLRARVVPGTESTRPYMSIVLDGYGETGLPDTVTTYSRPVDSNRDLDREFITTRMKQVMSDQRRLHLTYGPLPGAHRDRIWTVDAPTARMLARTGRGSAIARDFVVGNPCDTGEAGVTLRIEKGRVLGCFDLGPRVKWKGNRLDAMGTQMSDVVASALEGRSIRHVVEHPTLGSEETVTRAVQRVSKTGNTLVVHARPEMIPIERIDALTD